MVIDEFVKKFFKNHWDLLEDKKFDELYEKFNDETPYRYHILTIILLEAGIDPINYFDGAIPPAFAYTSRHYKDVVIPSNINLISDSAFLDSNLSSVDLKYSNVETIGEFAFSANPNLTKVEFPNTLVDIRKQAFNRTDLKEIIIPENVDVIHYRAFTYNKNCERIIIKNPDCFIGELAFYGCTANLKEFQLPKKYWAGIQLRRITGIKNTIPFKKSGIKFTLI